ncbi:N-Acetylglucosaminyltransferase-IV region [Ancylostoma duodenale]|uniref:N-Acetylglucosaminyltransferase-IV region n=1 Tax=Ancylostoma duodenale TaxID=51022 RepID=A0A0C2H803_9BILA|nr:N-Acetylglucosaminyltransferase-IV region [Ancylostoma duodenale]
MNGLMLKLRSFYLITILGVGIFLINVVKFSSLHHSRIPDEDRLQEQPSMPSTEIKGLAFPGFLDNFPELLKVSLDDFRPLLLTSRGRVPKQIVIAIPVAQRKKDYTLATLESLFNGTRVEDRKDVVFIVMLAYNDERITSALDKSAEIMNRFPEEVAAGLLEVIAVPMAWYQIDVANVPPTLNDSSSRMYWRTKQNIVAFYDELDDVIRSAPESNYVAVAGDFNGHVGQDRSASKEYMEEEASVGEI